MTSHLPEHSYLQGERAAELEEAQVGDGRELWTPIDNKLLYNAEDLQWSQEHESEFIADEGANYFYGDGPECRNGSVALNYATQKYNEMFRRTHLGMSKNQVEYQVRVYRGQVQGRKLSTGEWFTLNGGAA
jgi:hypothetical protein